VRKTRTSPGRAGLPINKLTFTRGMSFGSLKRIV
jgi:hypothetical protein